jgi:hypothetical protein
MPSAIIDLVVVITISSLLFALLKIDACDRVQNEPKQVICIARARPQEGARKLLPCGMNLVALSCQCRRGDRVANRPRNKSRTPVESRKLQSNQGGSFHRSGHVMRMATHNAKQLDRPLQQGEGRRTRYEQISSARLPNADIAGNHRHFAFVITANCGERATERPAVVVASLGGFAAAPCTVGGIQSAVAQ